MHHFLYLRIIQFIQTQWQLCVEITKSLPPPPYLCINTHVYHEPFLHNEQIASLPTFEIYSIFLMVEYLILLGSLQT